MILPDDLSKALGLMPLVPIEDNQTVEITGCYLGDLLSNVMSKAQPGNLWFTVMTNPNIVAVAHLLGLAGIVILEGHEPMQDTLEKAQREQILLFSSQDSAYEAACRFRDWKAGL
jgi:hypothetical protein